VKLQDRSFMFSDEGEERGPGAIIRHKPSQPAEADDLSLVFVAGLAHPHATSRINGCSTQLKRNIRATGPRSSLEGIARPVSSRGVVLAQA
jgi:hypothetical protein